MSSKCFPRCHMTLEEHGLYTYAASVSYESRKFYLSGPKVALEYRDTGRNVIYRVGQLLIESGWFKVISPRFKDRVTGLWKPAVVRPLTHDEWVAKYGDATCRANLHANGEPQPCTKTGMDANPCTNSSMHGFEQSMHDSESSMHDLASSMHGIVNKSRSSLEVSLEESEREPEAKSKPPLAPSNSQINGQVSELKSWMLGLNPPLKFLPASKDKEQESTKTIIARRLKEGITVADIKSAVSCIPLDNDPNPSFAIRDSLDAAVDRVLRDTERKRQIAAMLVESTRSEQSKAQQELAAAEADRLAEELLIEDELPIEAVLGD